MKQQVIETILAIFIAFMWWIASFLLNERHTVFDFISSIFLAGFSGWLILLFSQHMGFSDNITWILCWIGWFSGRGFLLILRHKFLKKVKNLDFKTK